MRTRKRFWTKVDTSGDCWIWKSSMAGTGYGLFRLDGRDQYAHRCALSLTGVRLKPGHVVMHICDTPACVRPSHLKQGTRAENLRDCRQKGRAKSWGKPQVYLSEEQRREVFTLLEMGVKVAGVAKKFDISEGLVYKIRREFTQIQ